MNTVIVTRGYHVEAFHVTDFIIHSKANDNQITNEAHCRMLAKMIARDLQDTLTPSQAIEWLFRHGNFCEEDSAKVDERYKVLKEIR